MQIFYHHRFLPLQKWSLPSHYLLHSLCKSTIDGINPISPNHAQANQEPKPKHQYNWLRKSPNIRRLRFDSCRYNSSLLIHLRVFVDRFLWDYAVQEPYKEASQEKAV